MKGYPSHLNSKADYEYVKANFPDKWKAEYQALLDDLYAWFFTGTLDSKNAGVEDDTHKIVEEKKMDSDEVIYQQYELKESPTAKLFQLGFTVEELKAALK